MRSFNPRIGLREAIRFFPKWKQWLINWFNAPSLHEIVQQQGDKINRVNEGATDIFRDVWQQLDALKEQSKALNRRLEVLEMPTGTSGSLQGSGKASGGRA